MIWNISLISFLIPIFLIYLNLPVFISFYLLTLNICLANFQPWLNPFVYLLCSFSQATQNILPYIWYSYTTFSLCFKKYINATIPHIPALLLLVQCSKPKFLKLPSRCPCFILWGNRNHQKQIFSNIFSTSRYIKIVLTLVSFALFSKKTMTLFSNIYMSINYHYPTQLFLCHSVFHSSQSTGPLIIPLKVFLWKNPIVF